MFDGLTRELATIRTRKFHIVEPLTGPELQDLMDRYRHLPEDYLQFLVQFGRSRLYRDGDSHLMTVSPVRSGLGRLGEGSDDALVFGGRTTADACFRISDIAAGRHRVYEMRTSNWLPIASTFTEWLEKSCAWARKQFTKTEWKHIIEGPAPFNVAELCIVEARKQFRWRVLRKEEKAWVFEVENHSGMRLPYLTIGYRTLDGRPFSGVWLKVGDIEPGSSAAVRDDWSHWNFLPQDYEAYQEPDPEPEDRDRYWEFSGLPKAADQQKRSLRRSSDKTKSSPQMYLAKANNDLISHCACPEALIAAPAQADCPWCGCGWLFVCQRCHKSFAFAKAVVVEESWDALALRDMQCTDEAEVSRDDIRGWVQAMRKLLRRVEPGRVYTYLDGRLLDVESGPKTFNGLHSRHRLNSNPHVAALTNTAVLKVVLQSEEYWRSRELR